MRNQRKKKTLFIIKSLLDLDPLIVFFTTFVIYLLTAYPNVATEDAGELIVSAIKPDVAHPPGYPTYVLIGKLFSLLVPFGNMAWRINIMSGFFGALAATLLYSLLKKTIKNDLIAFAASILFGFGNIVWGQSNRAEVYTLNTFFLILVIYLLYHWNIFQNNHWLYITAFVYGLSLGNHHLMFLALPAIVFFILLKNWKIIVKPKIIVSALFCFLLGLSIYAYLPLRTYFAPYDNPAYIEHRGLYTWNNFFNFVNRKIYGETIATPTIQLTQAVQAAKSRHIPLFLENVKDFFVYYGNIFIKNNKNGFFALLRILIQEYFYLPVFFFIPGFYMMFKKDWRWGAFISALFLSYISLLLIFIAVEPNAYTFSYSSEHPFFIPALLIASIVLGHGFAWLKEIVYRTIPVANKNFCSLLGLSLLLMLPFIAIGKNFTVNNQSGNYIAYDFNRNLLESMPLNGYLISTGRDNMTFPLYYLQKAEGIRKDVHVEIYYFTVPIDENYLKAKLKETGEKTIFIDILPPKYNGTYLQPYNYIYQYGDGGNLPSPKISDFQLRGIRGNLAYADNCLKNMHFIKLAILNHRNPQEYENCYRSSNL